MYCKKNNGKNSSVVLLNLLKCLTEINKGLIIECYLLNVTMSTAIILIRIGCVGTDGY